jgi:hypothetical protein
MESDVRRQKIRQIRLDHLLLACSILLVAVSAYLVQRNVHDFHDNSEENRTTEPRHQRQ